MPKKIQNTEVFNYVFVCSKMHPQTGIYEIAGVFVEDNDAETFLSLAEEIKIVKKVEVFIVGNLAAPVNSYSSLEEFNGEEE